jgi:hypothetical protein
MKSCYLFWESLFSKVHITFSYGLNYLHQTAKDLHSILIVLLNIMFVLIRPIHDLICRKCGEKIERNSGRGSVGV